MDNKQEIPDCRLALQSLLLPQATRLRIRTDKQNKIFL